MALKVMSGADYLFYMLINPALIASSSQIVNLMPNGEFRAVNVSTFHECTMPFAPVVLGPGQTIGTETDNIKAGDQWDGIRLSVIAESV
jgi:hypothetical protein